ncbi:MAG: methyltransferase domain-containing protein [Taibaiella sp.]|jgi:ubiquinone/menaquinone biosynthesis C-methylase UbiE
MELSTAIKLIDNTYLNKDKPETWADLGCGNGLFTKALATLLADGSTIYAIDKADTSHAGNMISTNKTNIIFRKQDIEMQELELPPLNGILMANVLHYVKNKGPFLEKLKQVLKRDASFLIVEYDTEQPVPYWVPFPLSFNAATQLFRQAGYKKIEKLGSQASLYQHSNLYSAIITP